MSAYVGNKGASTVRIIIDRGLSHVNITDADVRTGKISIGSNGEKIIGASNARFLERSTADATAVSDDINSGKTGYNNGIKITGSYTAPTINTAINGDTASYKVAAGNTISSGKFVKLVNNFIITNTTTVGTSSPKVFNNSFTTTPRTIKLSDTSILAIYSSSSNSDYAVAQIFTMSNATFNAGTKTVFTTVRADDISVVSLTSSKVLVVYTDNNTSYRKCRILTISGTTISSTQEYNMISQNTTFSKLIKLSDTKVLLVYKTGTENGSGAGRCRIITVNSSNVPSIGSEFTFSSNTVSHISVTQLSESKILIAYRDITNSNDGSVCIATIDGNNIAFSSPYRFETVSIPRFINIQALTETTALVSYCNNTSTYYAGAYVLTINGSTISKGTKLTYNTDLVYYSTMLVLSKDKAVAVYHAAGSGVIKARVLTISGTTITAGTELTIASTGIYDSDIIQLKDNVIFLTYIDTNIGYYGTSLQLNVNTTTNVLSNTILSYTGYYETQIANLTSSDDNIGGISKTSGNAGSTIPIYVPYN